DIRLAIAKHNQGNAISYRDLASSYYNIGEVLLPLGKAQEALVNQKAALENQEKALSLDAGNRDLQLKLSLIHVSLATDYEALGRLEEHRQSNLTALAIRKELVDSDPDKAEWKRLLGYAYFWVGDDYLDDGKPAEALKNYQLCLSL